MDDNETPRGDIELDPILQQKFADLTNDEAPDTWASVQHPPIAPPASPGPLTMVPEPEAEIVVLERVQNSSSSVLRIAAAVVLLMGLGLWGRSRVSGSDEAQIEIAEGTKPTTSVPVEEAEGCDPEQLQRQFQSGMDLIDFDSTSSLGDLVARSERRVFGRLVHAYGFDGGSILTIGTFERQEIWIPSRVVSGSMDGFVIAFLSDEIVKPAGDVRAVLPEGLWVSCSPPERVLPALSVPEWRTVGVAAATLDELWGMAAETETQVEVEQVSIDSGAAVFRISAGSSKIRLSLPVAVVGDSTSRDELRAWIPGSGVQISGENFDVLLRFQSYCEEIDEATTINSLGSFVQVGADGVIVCRPMEGLTATVSSLDGVVVDPELFDLRSIDEAQARWFGDFGPGIPEVGPWAVGSIVTRIGDSELAGLNPETLEEIWRFDSSGPEIWPTVKQSALLVGDGSRLVRLDPASGDELWSTEFPEDGSVTYLLDSLDGRVLRFSSTVNAQTDQVAAVEKIDVNTGEVLWRATGRPGGGWSSTYPIQTNGVVLVGEHLDSDEGGDGVITYALDDATGEVLWVSDFEIGDARYIGEGAFASFIVTRDRTALIMRTVKDGVVRVDPQTGEILWSAVVQWGPIIGRQVAADGVTVGVAISTPNGTVLLDPFTGERLP